MFGSFSNISSLLFESLELLVLFNWFCVCGGALYPKVVTKDSFSLDRFGFADIKSNLNELRIQAKSRSDELITKLREQKVTQLAKLVNSANFGAENKLYRWGLEKALIEAGQKCEQAMKVKLDNKTSKTLKDKSLWSEYITSLEANAMKAFESEFEAKTARAFELANKTHNSMKKLRG